MSGQQLISEYLQDYRSNDVLFQIGQNWRLTQELERLAKELPGMKFLLFCVRRHAGFDGRESKQVSPDHVLGFCEKVGLKNVDSVAAWCSGMARIDADALQKSILQSINLPGWHSGFPLVSPQQILDLVKRDCDVRDLEFESEDMTFRAPDSDTISQITKECPLRFRDYEPEEFDCDDFSRGAKQWLADNGYGTLALGVARVVVENAGGDAIMSHKLCVFVLWAGSNLFVTFFEPQTGRIFSPREYGDRGLLGGGWRYVVTRVVF